MRGDGAAVSEFFALLDGGDREMDRRSWLWRRKSSDKSPAGETESSGSVSSHSERYSDDQEVSKSSPNHPQSPEVSEVSKSSPNHSQSPEVSEVSISSPNHSQSLEVSSNITSYEDNDTVKSLTEKLSAALLNIRAKEDLVKQHTKVAEEAVSGWENADNEVASLKQQLEATVRKNCTLEDKISHLDGALKECVRQLRQSREEHEQRAQEAMVKNTQEWESEKFELESQIIGLEAQLEVAKEVSASVNHDLQVKLEAVEKENAILKSELLTQSEELNMRTLERELSTCAAETASKQHLESIKKVTKLEAECRRLRAIARKAPSNDHKPFANSVYVESLTDSQSDSGERLLALDNEPSCSDSWASALIAELDQFKTAGRNAVASSVEIDLMDDFLEMEKLAASEADHDASFMEPQVSPAMVDTEDISLKAEIKALLQRSSELEEMIGRIKNGKADVEKLLAETRDHFEQTCKKLEESEEKVMNLQKQLIWAKDSKQVAEIATEAAKAKTKLLESKIESSDTEVQQLQEKIDFLEGKIKEEKALSAELALKCENLENELLTRKQEAESRRAVILNGELKVKQEKELATAAGKLAECQKTIASLGQQLRSLGKLEDFMVQDEKMGPNGISPIAEFERMGKYSLSNVSRGTNGPASLLKGKETHFSSSSSSSGFAKFLKVQDQ